MKKIAYLPVIGLLFMLFIVIQLVSTVGVEEPGRETDSDVFQEIIIMKAKNNDLRNEIGQLEGRLGQLENRSTALEGIEAEMERYRKLSGLESVYGAGVSVKIEGALTMPWMVDLVNEIFSSGAQAVAVNDIRLTNRSAGFDSLPQGQITLNGSILSPPYVVNAIGDHDTLVSALQVTGGIFARIKAFSPDIKIEVSSKEVIQMK